MPTRRLLRLLAPALLLLIQQAQAGCANGIYGESPGQRLVLSGAPASQRYAFVDGRRGALPPAHAGLDAGEAPLRCHEDRVELRLDGRWVSWPQQAYRETPLRFASQGSELAGMLIEAPGAEHARPPLLVFVHGSEKSPALGSVTPYLLAAQGLSVFVYDKRGTGASGGEYTQNFELLAEDASAAAREARRLAQGRHGRFGFAGFSQGGWVAPLAARRSGADFVVVGFGLMLSPLEEDREQVLAELREAGHGPAVLAKARRLTEATATLVASHFERGHETLAALKRRHAGEPWLGQIRGEYSGAMIASDAASLRRLGRALYDNLELIWDYDAERELRALRAPLLWVMAGEDREAPGAVTLQRLERLRRSGQPITLYRFPDTDHGMWEFEQAADGSRRPTRVTEGYFRLLGDWILGREDAPYGRGERLF